MAKLGQAAAVALPAIEPQHIQSFCSRKRAPIEECLCQGSHISAVAAFRKSQWGHWRLLGAIAAAASQVPMGILCCIPRLVSPRGPVRPDVDLSLFLWRRVKWLPRWNHSLCTCTSQVVLCAQSLNSSIQRGSLCASSDSWFREREARTVIKLLFFGIE